MPRHWCECDEEECVKRRRQVMIERRREVWERYEQSREAFVQEELDRLRRQIERASAVMARDHDGEVELED